MGFLAILNLWNIWAILHYRKKLLLPRTEPVNHRKKFFILCITICILIPIIFQNIVSRRDFFSFDLPQAPENFFVFQTDEEIKSHKEYYKKIEDLYIKLTAELEKS